MERKSRFERRAARVHALLVLGAVIACAGIAANAEAADPLGRLFTSPQQRKQLDELRAALPVGDEVKAPQLLADEPEDSAAPAEVAGGITVKGLVTRKEGQSTAWINDSNTFEGDLATQYLKIENRDIRTGGVEINVPDHAKPNEDKQVRVKVGETYNPATGEMKDIATENSEPSAPQAVEQDPEE